jgi:hypothetical protein
MLIKYCIIFFLFILVTIEQSCMPKDAFDRNKDSKCIFFNPGTKQIIKACNDGGFNYVTHIEVEVRYDTIKFIHNQPYSSYTLFEDTGKINFPYSLDPVIKNKNEVMSIHLRTDNRSCSYSLTLHEKDWLKDSLFFVFYYHRK